MKFTAIAVVPCDGQEHRLGLTTSGRLVALDHNLRRERNRAELGGSLPYCIRVIDNAFRVSDPASVLPLPFRDHALAAVARRQSRRARSPGYWDLMRTRERMEAWFRLAAWGHLRECPYHWPADIGGFDFVLYKVYSVGETLGVPSLVWRSPGGSVACSTVLLALPWRWWRAVHLAGLGTVGLDIGYGRRPYFVQDNLTPGSLTPVLRVVDQDEGSWGWQTRRVQIRLADGSLVGVQPPEVGSLAKPHYRDYPWREPCLPR